MDSRKGNVLVILLGVILLIAASVAGYLYSTATARKIDNSYSKVPAKTIADPSSLLTKTEAVPDKNIKVSFEHPIETNREEEFQKIISTLTLDK